MTRKKIHEKEDGYPFPACILKQRCLYLKGVYYNRIEKYDKAEEAFKRCLKEGQYYDPEIRKNCLIALKEIYEFESNEKTEFDGKDGTQPEMNIEKMLNKFDNQPKDVVVLLDNS